MAVFCTFNLHFKSKHSTSLMKLYGIEGLTKWSRFYIWNVQNHIRLFNHTSKSSYGVTVVGFQFEHQKSWIFTFNRSIKKGKKIGWNCQKIGLPWQTCDFCKFVNATWAAFTKKHAIFQLSLHSWKKLDKSNFFMWINLQRKNLAGGFRHG